MKLIVRAFLLAALGWYATPLASATTPAVPTFPHLQNDPLFDQTTYQELRDITVDVSWNKVELGTVLRDLTLMVRRTHPIHASINFRMSSTASPADRMRRISLTLRGAPVYQVLEYLSQQASFTIKVHPDIVLIMPGKTP